MTTFSTIDHADLALVIGGAETEGTAGAGPFHVKLKHVSDPPAPPDSEAYLRCAKQSYDQSPLYDRLLRPNREARFAERMCGQYRHS